MKAHAPRLGSGAHSTAGISMDDQRIAAGLQRLHAGDRRGAARLFTEILRQYPRDEQAWWWLAGCVDSTQKKRECYRRILTINPQNALAQAALEQLDQTQPLPLVLAQAAESAGNYHTAYMNYGEVLTRNAYNTSAWFGKGFAAGMLSTPTHNQVRESFVCFEQGLRIHTIHPSMPRETLLAQLTAMDVLLAHTLTTYLLTLAETIRHLMTRCKPNMANIYAVEYVHLLDWAYCVIRSTGTDGGRTCTQREVIQAAEARYEEIAARIQRTTRGPRARSVLLTNFRQFLLSNLSLSEIHQNPDLLAAFDKIQRTYSR